MMCTTFDIAQSILESKRFYYFILFIIVLNSITIGLETYEPARLVASEWFTMINQICLGVFVFEFILRLYVHRLSFFRRKWDDFDLLVVLISLLSETTVFSMFRFLRVIRLLRLLSIIPKMKLISEVLLNSLSAIFSVGILLVVVYYIYAVIVTTLYGQAFPQWFGTIWESFYTLFQIMTFESWSMGIVRPVMAVYPQAWIIFVSFLIIATYIVLNIVIGIIVDCIGEIKERGGYVEKDRKNQEILMSQISHLEEEIQSLKILIQEQHNTKR